MMDHSISIRPMIFQDIEQVHVIDRLSFSMPWPANSFRFELNENKNARLFVAEKVNADNYRQVIGVIVTWLVVDEAHIATLAVDPAYRGQGVGRRLVEAALQDALQHKMVEATLEVRSGNQVAINLYRSLGFEIVGNRPRYYRDNHEDALIMTLQFSTERDGRPTASSTLTSNLRSQFSAIFGSKK
jgi:ribosomal-protein-alanine N-acetyltransferase